jgi:hypothetical protein
MTSSWSGQTCFSCFSSLWPRLPSRTSISRMSVQHARVAGVAGLELQAVQVHPVGDRLRVLLDGELADEQEAAGAEDVHHGAAEVPAAHEAVLILVGQELLNVDADVAARGQDARQLLDHEPHVEGEAALADIDGRAVVAHVFGLARVGEQFLERDRGHDQVDAPGRHLGHTPDAILVRQFAVCFGHGYISQVLIGPQSSPLSAARITSAIGSSCRKVKPTSRSTAA